MSTARSLARLSMGVMLVVLAGAASAWAERPPERKQDAALIVLGRVEKVYTNVDQANTNQIVVIRVDRVERGQGFRPGDLVDARCFRRLPSAPHIPAPSGHRDFPSEGERIRAYLNVRDGGVYEGVYPSWVDTLGPFPPGPGPGPNPGPLPGPGPGLPRWSLGVFTQPLGAGNRGALQITRIVPGGAAQRAGLEQGDVIVDANGTPVRTPQDLKQAIDRSRGSLRMTIRDFRTGRTMQTAVTLDRQ